MSDKPNFPADLGRSLLEQALEYWVKPEIERRYSETGGEENSALGSVDAFQVIMRVGESPGVRLNEEVRAVMKIEAAGEIDAGDPVTEADIRSIEDIELTTADEDAGHITAVRLGGEWRLSFDFRYNAGLSSEHLDAGEEFLHSAKWAWGLNYTRAFVENIFNAVELLAKARLFLIPDETLLKPTISHRTVKSLYNRHFGRTEDDVSEYKGLLNNLMDVRSEVRHLHDVLVEEKQLQLENEEAEEIIERAEDFRDWVEINIPERHELDFPEM